jgi:hypothetical protein
MEIIAMCGLDCGTCPAYRAHVTDDWALREATAKEWSKTYGFEAKPEMIDCVGCTEIEGVHVGYCFECAIRKCGLGRGVVNCAVCELYEGCPTLGGFLAKVPLAKANLEKIRFAADPKATAKPKAKLKVKTKAKPKPKPRAKAKAKVKSKAKPKPKVRPKKEAAPRAKKPVKKTRRSR